MTITFWPRRTRREIATSRFHQASYVLATAQGDELVLFDTRGERYYTLNEVGSRIWALLAKEGSPETIVACLRAEYACSAGAENDAVEQDVMRILEALHSARLISIEDARHGS